MFTFVCVGGKRKTKNYKTYVLGLYSVHKKRTSHKYAFIVVLEHTKRTIF